MAIAYWIFQVILLGCIFSTYAIPTVVPANTTDDGSYVQNSTVVITCKIQPYTYNQEWRVNKVYVAGCILDICAEASTNPERYLFKNDTTNGIFVFTINKVPLSDNGTVIGCFDGSNTVDFILIVTGHTSTVLPAENSTLGVTTSFIPSSDSVTTSQDAQYNLSTLNTNISAKVCGICLGDWPVECIASVSVSAAVLVSAVIFSLMMHFYIEIFREKFYISITGGVALLSTCIALVVVCCKKGSTEETIEDISVGCIEDTSEEKCDEISDGCIAGITVTVIASVVIVINMVWLCYNRQ